MPRVSRLRGRELDLASAHDGSQDLVARVRGRNRGPVRQLMAKPSVLPFCIVANVELRVLGCLRKRQSARQMADEPRHAVRLHDRKQWIQAALGQSASLRPAPPPSASHQSAHRCARRVLRVPDAINNFTDLLRLDQRRRLVSCVPIAERAAGREHDLERTRDPLTVVRFESLRRSRHRGARARREAPASPSAASRSRTVLRTVDRDRRHRRKSARQCLEIEPSAADEDRQLAVALGAQECVRASPKVAPDRIVQRRVDMTVEPMRYPRLLVRRSDAPSECAGRGRSASSRR